MMRSGSGGAWRALRCAPGVRRVCAAGSRNEDGRGGQAMSRPELEPKLETMEAQARPGNAGKLAAVLLLAAACFPATAWAAWPTLDRQLSKDRVQPGSALARLIAANQDFALLRVAEQNDHIPLPPWLRVLWRKSHPQGKPIPGDPTGGYPLA